MRRGRAWVGKGEADLFSGDVVQKDSHSVSSLATGVFKDPFRLRLLFRMATHELEGGSKT